MRRPSIRALCALILVALALCVSPVTASASQEVPPDATGAQTEYDIYVSPLLSDENRECELESFNAWVQSERDKPVELQGYATFYDRDSAASYLAEHMVARDGLIEFTIWEKGSELDVKALFEDIYARATAEGTGSPVRGDYLAHHLAKRSWECTYNSYGSSFWYQYSITLTYYASASQESQTTTAVNTVLNQIGARNVSDYEAVLRIHDWIVTNVAYDYEHVADDYYYSQFSAYGAVVNRKAVCQGMALLFYRMCHEVGVDCRYISGVGSNAGGSGRHGWNIVKLGRYWYNVDTTWEDNVGGASTHNWFLKSQANFPGHSRDSEYTTASFNAAHPMGPSNFDPSSVQLVNIAGASITGAASRYLFTGYAITPSVTVRLNGTTLTKNVDYTLGYENNVTPGTARIVATGKGEYTGQVSAAFEIYWTTECAYYADTPLGAWYITQNVIDYVVEAGIMSGYTTAGGKLTGYFGPEDPISRGQVAVILHRMAGEPEVEKAQRFSDVNYSAYYGDAISWVRSRGIVSGYGDTNKFGPDDPVTREQLVKMLGGFAGIYYGLDTSSSCVSASRISGWSSVSSFARTYMGWAVDKAIMGGVTQSGVTTLLPQGTASRSQAAKMLMVLDRDVIGDTPPYEEPPADPQEGSADGFSYAIFTGKEDIEEGDYLAYLDIDSDLSYWGPGIYLYGYTGTATDLTIPAKVNGQPVRAVDLSFVDVTSLDVSRCAQLSQLEVLSDLLTELDVTNCPDLRVLSVSSEKLTELDVTRCTKLDSLRCRFCALDELDVSKCTKLTYLDLDGNNLSEVNVRPCTQLLVLSVAWNRLRELDVTCCPKLTYLGCAFNLLTELDVSTAPDLLTLYCNGNLIEDTSALEAWLGEGTHDGQVLPQE